MSRHRDKKHAVLPVPIIITEPAIGYGGDVALGLGLAAYRPLHDDAIRYLGILGATALGLHFYGFDPSGVLALNPLRYDFMALGTLQRAQFRYRDTKWYGGLHYLFIDTKSSFATATLPAEVRSRDLRDRIGGAGASLEYDSRDNVIDARRGQDINANVTLYGPPLGGTTVFQKLRVAALLYSQPRERLGFGGRIDARTAWGDVPFFDMPYLSMRGLRAQQYSNNVAELQEGEVHYDVATRWTVLGFGGVGFTAKSWSDIGTASAAGAGGVGFRYLLAERLHLRSGIDVAMGPGGRVAVYVQNGAAWR